MKLKTLSVREDWNNPDSYRGEIEFAGNAGKITVPLNDTLSRRVLAVCADEIVEAGKTTAQALTAETINAQLEAPKHGDD